MSNSAELLQCLRRFSKSQTDETSSKSCPRVDMPHEAALWACCMQHPPISTIRGYSFYRHAINPSFHTTDYMGTVNHDANASIHIAWIAQLHIQVIHVNLCCCSKTWIRRKRHSVVLYCTNLLLNRKKLRFLFLSGSSTISYRSNLRQRW